MNKKILITLGILGIMFVSAAIINFSVSRDVTVNPAFTFTGDNSINANIEGGESVYSDTLNVESDTSVNIPLSIITTPDEEGITHTINYLLDNSEGTCAGYPDGDWREDCEKRIDFDGMALSLFDTMSWDVNVIEGYVSHVDLILDNGEALTIEYATFDSDCNAPSTYPEGEYEFIIDGDTYAWESIPGACGDGVFEAQHNTLTEWKATYPTATITRIEIEVDNWMMDMPGHIYNGIGASSIVSNVVINGEDVSEKPFLLPSGELNFNVETEFDVGIVGDYTIETTITTR